MAEDISSMRRREVLKSMVCLPFAVIGAKESVKEGSVLELRGSNDREFNNSEVMGRVKVDPTKYRYLQVYITVNEPIA